MVFNRPHGIVEQRALRNALRSVLRALTPLVLVFAMSTTAHAQSSRVYAVPDLDYSAICRAGDAPPPLDRDWTRWDEATIDLDFPDALAITREYTSGSTRVEKDPETALRILRVLERQFTLERTHLHLPIARALMEVSDTAERLAEAEERLLRAHASGVRSASFALGQFYGSSGPAAVRDLELSRSYLQRAAATGDARALVDYVKLEVANPAVDFARKNVLVDRAISALIAQIEAGHCRYLGLIGLQYLNGGFLVEQDLDAAHEWLTVFADTGDALGAHTLATLLSDRTFGRPDMPRALRYLTIAADGGIAQAAFDLGRHLLTGVTVEKNVDNAVRYLRFAATRDANGADLLLARLYSGEFDAEPDFDLAKQHFDAALVLTSDPVEVASRYGQFLSEHGRNAGDQERAVDLLKMAADRGSVSASTTLGELYLEIGAEDPAAYQLAFERFRFSSRHSNATAALRLSTMYACGAGVPRSSINAQKWLETAATYGSRIALFRVGLSSLDEGTREARLQGERLIKLAAFSGSPQAIGYLTSRWERGVGGFAEDLEAAGRLTRFVENHPDAVFRANTQIEIIKARALVAASDPEKLELLAELQSLIDQGHDATIFEKAKLMREAGLGSHDDIVLAYEAAAETEDPRALREYGRLLLADADSSAREAQDYLTRAAELGDTKAMLLLVDEASETALAELYEIAGSGLICTVDHMVEMARKLRATSTDEGKEEAFEWMQLAEEFAGGDPSDLAIIASALRDGVTGEDHVERAEAYFGRSAVLGRHASLRDIAQGHIDGIWDDRNIEGAKALLTALASAGDREAATMLISGIAGEVFESSSTDGLGFTPMKSEPLSGARMPLNTDSANRGPSM